MLNHLAELRSRAIRILILLLSLCSICYCYSHQLYDMITFPFLQSAQNKNANLVMTEIIAPFTIHLELSLWCACAIIMPYVIYQLWQFIKPGLYPREVKVIRPLLFVCCALFYVGFSFAFFVVAPVVLRFFIGYTPHDVQLMINVAQYLEFILTVCIITGLILQIPVITHILIRANLITRAQMAAKRKHVIVAALVLGMILAPPDLVSQLLISLPMWVLFELGLLVPYK